MHLSERDITSKLMLATISILSPERIVSPLPPDTHFHFFAAFFCYAKAAFVKRRTKSWNNASRSM